MAPSQFDLGKDDCIDLLAKASNNVMEDASDGSVQRSQAEDASVDGVNFTYHSGDGDGEYEFATARHYVPRYSAAAENEFFNCLYLAETD